MAEILREDILKEMNDAAERMGLDLEDLQEMIGDVIEDCTTKSKALQEAISTSDVTSIKAISHDIKGSTANYGLNEASALAKSIENNSESQPTETAAKLVDYLAQLSALDLESTR